MTIDMAGEILDMISHLAANARINDEQAAKLIEDLAGTVNRLIGEHRALADRVALLEACQPRPEGDT